MSLQTQLASAFTRVGTEFKSVRTTIGSLTALTTTQKGNLVGAINEVKASIPTNAATVNDTTASTSSVYSSTKTDGQISAAIGNLLGGADAAYDTLKELQTILQSNDTNVGAINTALGNRLRFDAAQTLTTAQQTQGQDNLQVYSRTAIGNPETDFTATFVAALV